MTAVREGFTQTPDPLPRRAVRLAVLGDSTAVGLGDPVPGGSWRGVGPFVAEALGIPPAGYLNTAFTGARMRCVRTDQLPAALRHRPDVAVVIVGMNDTLRSDFDSLGMARDLEHVVTALQAVGATVVTMRFHDHSRVFRLPGPLRRALTARIAELNDVIETIARRHGVACLDLGSLPGAYDLAAWSVDRLHPSELGHRLLARGVTELVADAGIAVPSPVSLVCSGGVTPRTVDHVGWLVVKGIPWLWRRGRDLLPYAAAIVARSALESWRARRAEPLEPELAPRPVER
ncbi:SGNH/GDSL hydrolase family protein [Amycolatopsis thermoflava]|uniref:SGNH/GDSL hydrolase family protein n=1 Tax=Amycolatopsis thermoflava TaxID=84480 RepID=UPI00364FF0EA